MLHLAAVQIRPYDLAEGDRSTDRPNCRLSPVHVPESAQRDYCSETGGGLALKASLSTTSNINIPVGCSADVITA
ncbi:unnamed protein product [Cylicostephanus goldi]|uniref:Uncharacterized protein n=1 Tax=Cylicostephanus goldi TaxID=71465 RepID=A0A3P6TC25_CYLGO|nr:unnamed protein product [Cylicostephanus goldi]